MSTPIVGDLKELRNIVNEIKRLQNETRGLRLRKKVVEDKICDFPEDNNQLGIKIDSIAVIKKEKKQRHKKNKTEKEECATAILDKEGIKNSKHVLKTVLDSMKGEEYLTEGLQIKENKGPRKKN